MLAIESNIDGIIRQAEALRRNVPVAMARALEPGRWAVEAREVAERTLLGLATLNTAKFVTGFVNTVMATGISPVGLCLRMNAPVGGGTTVAEAQAARGATSAADLFENLFLGPVQRFEELLQEWVETEKRKDRRDLGKMDEEIARDLSVILLSPAPTARMLQARAALTPHIEEFLARKASVGGVDEATANEWLRAVLAGWRVLVTSKFAERVREALEGMKGALL